MLTPEEVAEKHLTAVKGGDPFLMAEDYAQDALLVRGEDVFAGKEEIFNYFAGVPNRMGSGVIKFMKFTSPHFVEAPEDPAPITIFFFAVSIFFFAISFLFSLT